jgi:hypothetical protein
MVQDWKDSIKRESKTTINGNILQQSNHSVYSTLWLQKLGTDQTDEEPVEFPTEMCPPYN